MQGIIKYFLKYPVAGNLLMFSILIGGLFGVLNLKKTFFPETESRVINIQAVYPGASPEEVEEGIITKIEENLRGVTGVERISSVSSENSGNVVVEVFKGYDTDIILQDVKNAVDRISSFPASMEPPVIFKREATDVAIVFALSGDVPLKKLKAAARKCEEELLAVDGISKIDLSGFPEEEIEIAFREKDLQSYNLSFQQALLAVRAANIEITGGKLKGQDEELLVRARNKQYYAEQLRNIVVKSNPDGSIVRLVDVANIRDKWSDNPNRRYLNNEPAVAITISNTNKEDILFITDYIKGYIENYNLENEEIVATVVRDRSVTLEQRIGLLQENGVIGFIIVVIFLAMFLNWRLAFWVGLAIPVSFAGMFIVGSMVGLSINVISLFGMILVIGILVDDGIVITENIYQLYEKGMDREEAAIKGTMGVLPAVFTAILTTVIAFSLFFFLDGRLGDFFVDMAVVVMLSLVFSLVEGALILPAHVAHSKALAPNKKVNPITAFFDRSMAWMRDKLYGPVLKFIMRYPFMGVIIPIGLLLLTAGGFRGGHIKGTFFPNIPRDNVDISIKMPAGTREHITEKWMAVIENAALEVNDSLGKHFYKGKKKPIEFIQKTLGPNSYTGSLSLDLIDGEERGNIQAKEIGNAIRELVGPISDAEYVTYGSASIFGKPISVSLLGSNSEELTAAVEEIKMALKEISDLKDVIDNNQAGLKEINITLKEKAHYLGLDLSTILSQVRAGFFGAEVQRLQRGRDEVRVWVRYDEQDRYNIGQLENMQIRFADGRSFILKDIVDFELKRGIVAINHIDGKREIQVTADVTSDRVSVSDVLGNVKGKVVPEILEKYPSVTPLYEGQNREQAKTSGSIAKYGPLILALMLLSIAFTFRSVSQTVMMIPFIVASFIGVAWGHWFMDTYGGLNAPISLFSILGLIALIGILVNDALVFVSAFNNRIESGEKFVHALYKSGLSRFRPIVLTSVTTIAGLAPLMAEKSLQAQFLIPMAISVSFGLLMITFIILVMLPALLVIINDSKRFLGWIGTGEWPSKEAVEPANKYDGGYGWIWPIIIGILGISILTNLYGAELYELLF